MFEQMIEIAERLAIDPEFVRVDLYCAGGNRVLFSEVAFDPPLAGRLSGRTRGVISASDRYGNATNCTHPAACEGAEQANELP